MSVQGNQKFYQEVIKTGKERISPIQLEDRLKAIGFEIDSDKTWEYLDYVLADRKTAIDCKMLYAKDLDSVNVKALTELRRSVFVFVNGFWWIF